MTDLLPELPLQLDNTPLSLALHVTIATTVFIAAIATSTMNPPHGGGTEAMMAVVVWKSGSIPHGGGRRGAPVSAPRWLATLHGGDEGSAVRPRLASRVAPPSMQDRVWRYLRHERLQQ
jgi:hypothetical protein